MCYNLTKYNTYSVTKVKKMENVITVLEQKKPASINKKREMLLQLYESLFNDYLKAKFLTLIQLHKQSSCTWNEIFEGSGLKEMGVSTSTVSKILKQLESAGVVKKKKAPFPYKVTYYIEKPIPSIALAVQNIENYLKQFPDTYPELTARQSTKLFKTLGKCFKEYDNEQALLEIFLFLHTLLHLVANYDSYIQG